METPNYGQEAVDFFLLKNHQALTRSWVLDWRGCFKQEMMWDAPSSFGL
jgi:hypothetical protein